jgi:hypothetical protein
MGYLSPPQVWHRRRGPVEIVRYVDTEGDDPLKVIVKEHRTDADKEEVLFSDLMDRDRVPLPLHNPLYTVTELVASGDGTRFARLTAASPPAPGAEPVYDDTLRLSSLRLPACGEMEGDRKSCQRQRQYCDAGGQGHYFECGSAAKLGAPIVNDEGGMLGNAGV